MFYSVQKKHCYKQWKSNNYWTKVNLWSNDPLFNQRQKKESKQEIQISNVRKPISGYILTYDLVSARHSRTWNFWTSANLLLIIKFFVFMGEWGVYSATSGSNFLRPSQIGKCFSCRIILCSSCTERNMMFWRLFWKAWIFLGLPI